MAEHTADPRITLHPHTRRVYTLAGDTLIAKTRDTIKLRERGDPDRPDLQKKLLRVDVDMPRPSLSSTVIHCPFEGDATYYSLPNIADVAWSYERPIDEMQEIAGRLAFDAENVAEFVE